MVPFVFVFCFFYTSFKLWACNTEEIPSDTPVELCCYYYLKINTPRKCSATDTLAFYTGKKKIICQDFSVNISLPFLWQISINSLAISKCISILWEDSFFVLKEKYIYRYPPVEEG